MAKKALVIGINNYIPDSDTAPGLKPLVAAINDARAMQAVLANPDIGDFQVIPLENPDAREMTEAIDDLFNTCHASDTLLLYFAGHGVKDDQGRLFFATRNTTKYADGRLKTSTAVPTRTVRELMETSSAARRVIILDCCFSGAFVQGDTLRDDGAVDVKAELAGEGWAVLTATTSTQYSREQEGEDLAIYTRYLVQGLSDGTADLDGDGAISADELHQYVERELKKSAPTMKPQRHIGKTGERIILAKAAINHRERQYRQFLADAIRSSTIRPATRARLDLERDRLHLSPERAAALEQQALQPYLDYDQNLTRYAQIFLAEVRHDYPLSPEARQELDDIQTRLNLKPTDAAKREATILKAEGLAPEPSSSSPQPPTPNSALRTFRFEIVTVNDKGSITERQQREAQQFLEDLGNGITLDMVQIPGGEFLMGAADGEEGASNDEYPQHRVTVTEFFMGKYPITQAQYQAIVGKNPSRFTENGSNRPVENVSWKDAMEFCQRLSKKTGKDYRLPSEAEWEYACRAGTTTPFYFGATITPDLVNYDGNYPYGNAAKGEYRQQTTEVGSFPPNAHGLYDLHGNVWEWCADNWHGNYNQAPSDGSIWKTKDFNNDPHVLRGGSWTAAL